MIPLVPLLFVFYPLQIFTQTTKYITNKPIRNNKTNSTNAISDRGVVSVGCKPSQENKKQNRKVNKAMMHLG